MSGDVTEEEIRSGLERLGLRRGCVVVVHSSLSSFGRVAGGAEAVAAAVADAVGPEGLVVMPLYASRYDADGRLLREPDFTRGVTTGAVALALARRQDAHVALHPLYSNAFLGRDAPALARQHARLMFPYGPDQPLRCLHARGGLILQLGTDDTTNTSIHTAEEIADPPYLAEKKSQSGLTVDEFIQMPPDAQLESLRHHQAGPRRDFRKATPLIEEAGLRRTIRIGRCRAALTDFVGMCDLLVERIRSEPQFLVVEGHSTP